MLAAASPSGDGTSELNSTLTDIEVVATVDSQADGKRFIVLTKPKGKETQITLVTNQITKSKK
jgi:Ni,Fe-hydrogenase III small subunit